jgi:hypothetical protein
LQIKCCRSAHELFSFGKKKFSDGDYQSGMVDFKEALKKYQNLFGVDNGNCLDVLDYIGMTFAALNDFNRQWSIINSHHPKEIT